MSWSDAQLAKASPEIQREAHRRMAAQASPMVAAPKRSKFGAVPTVINGIRFDSKAEAARYEALELQQRAGLIRNLCADKKQLRFPIIDNGEKICDYEADFSYVNVTTGLKIVEDSKGVRTPVYKLKKKLMKTVCGIEILETGKR